VKKALIKGAGPKVLPLFLFVSFLFASPFKWTLGLYMAGDNDLATALDEDLREIKKAKISKDLNVVIFADRGGFSESPGTYIYAKRDTFLITLLNLGNLDSGDPATLSFFVNYLKINFPSENYGLLIWGHGTGWSKSEPLFSKSVAYDAVSSSSIEVFNGELYVSLPDSLFNFIVFDACLMGSIEVLWELQSKTKYVIASPSLVPSFGLDYSKLLETLTADEDVGNVLKRIVDDYLALYDSLGFTVSLVVYDLSRIDTTEEILKGVVESSYSKTTTELLKYRFHALTYNTYSNEVLDTFAILVDVVDLLNKGWGIKTLPLIFYAKGNFHFRNSSFLSAYFPLSYSVLKRDFVRYEKLRFERRVKFSDLLLNTLKDSIAGSDTVYAHFGREKRGMVLTLQNLIKASKWQCELKIERDGILRQRLFSTSGKFLLRLTPGNYKLYVDVIPGNATYRYSLSLSPDSLRVDERDTPYYNSTVDTIDGARDILGRESKREKGILFKKGKKYLVY